MKQIYVLRHTKWDEINLEISQSGLDKIKALKPQLPKFSIIKSSPVKRTVETARLLTDQNPTIDKRASIIKCSKDQQREILSRRKNNPAGTFGAIMSIPELIEPLKNRSKELVLLIKETLAKLNENENALIISHDAIILGAKKILTNLPFIVANEKYEELNGFIINEKLQITDFKPKI